MLVAEKVWVVTGAGSGMGRALARELIRRGARVAAVDVSEAGLAETVSLADAGERISAHVVDITDADAVAALPEAVEATHGSVDGLINNAGIIQPFVPAEELDTATIDRVLDVNLLGTVRMTRAFLPALRERPEGHLANVSSMGGFFPFPGQSMYGASKAAVKLLTEGLYAELLDTAVGVSVIFPGAVNTAITANSGVAGPDSAADGALPLTTPEQAARIILAGIEKNKLHIYVGLDAKLMSLAIKLIPGPAIRFVKKQMAGRRVVPERT